MGAAAIHVPAWLAIGCLVLVVGFVVFAFRQGQKVTRPPEGVPPQRDAGA